MSDPTKLTELIRDANRDITPADRHLILDLIDEQAAEIAALTCDIERHIDNHAADLNVVTPATDGQQAAGYFQCLYDASVEAWGWEQVNSAYKNDEGVVQLYTHPASPDSVRRDAERYRWLRETTYAAAVSVLFNCPGQTPAFALRRITKALDQAIDAALSQQREGA